MLLDPLLDLQQPLVLLLLELLISDVDQVDNRLGSQEQTLVKNLDLLQAPLLILDPHSAFHYTLELVEHINLILDLLIGSSLQMLLIALKLVLDPLDVLSQLLFRNSLHVSNGVHTVLVVGHILIIEGSYNMVDTVHTVDM